MIRKRKSAVVVEYNGLSEGEHPRLARKVQPSHIGPSEQESFPCCGQREMQPRENS